jgi:hypothetical protein
MEMTKDEIAEMRRFVDLCHAWTDLIVKAPMETGDLLAFWKHSIMHGRQVYRGVGRITHVVLANRRVAAEERAALV